MEPLTKSVPELVLSGMHRMYKFAPGEFVICASSADAPITAVFLLIPSREGRGDEF